MRNKQVKKLKKQFKGLSEEDFRRIKKQYNTLSAPDKNKFWKTLPADKPIV